MAKLLTPEEASKAAYAKQAAKVAEVERKRAERAKARDEKREAAKLFAAHCADAAKAFRGGDFEGANASLSRAGCMLPEGEPAIMITVKTPQNVSVGGG